MKCLIPEISWHNRDPVLSVDIQPKPLEGDSKIRLASGGYDSHVLIWYITENDEGLPHLEFASDLARHLKPVSCVRWSPSGQFIASADDDSAIFIWKLRGENEPNLFDDSSEQNKETWNVFKTLRGHIDDVLDLSWSFDSKYLASGEVGCTAIVWDVMKGKSKFHLNEHKNFVQGVAWDPKDKYLATISSDRTLRLFDAKTGKVQRRINKSILPVEQPSPLYNKKIRLFHDDTLPTFYRRLCYSPDGNLLFVPSGCTDIITTGNEITAQNECKDDASNKMATCGSTDNIDENIEKSEKTEKLNKLQNTTYIFTRYSKEPAVVIPSADDFTAVVRCCPTIFKLRSYKENCPPMIDLPYRMVYAIASKSSVYLYDTQQRMPFGSISKIHYSRLTDVTWSSDGKILVASSFDGFCTLITFEDGELGEVYDQPINLIDPDENQTSIKKKRSSNDGKTKTSPKEQKAESTEIPARMKSISTKDNPELVLKPILEIPETIIASVETFESPEYKEKQATPIAVRRAPRTTPSSATEATKSSATVASSASAKKPKLIATRRQPRNILGPISAVVEKSATDQDEALDAWPIPIDAVKSIEDNVFKHKFEDKKTQNVEIISDETENMHLVYEGESEMSMMKTEATSDTKTTTNIVDNTQQSVPSFIEQSATPDAKNPKTPRRVQLRTISTPKSKKKA